MNVSVVIPAYNAAGTLADTLESLRAQSCPTWEAIVVDDGSVDETGRIAREFAVRDERIRVASQPNGGESAARNTGVGLARHDWLLFLDADDWIAPQHLERMTTALTADSTLDAVHCGSVRVARDGSVVTDPYQAPEGDLFPTLALRAAFPVHACIVRRSLVQSVGGFDTSLRKSPDWDLWQRIARTGARFGAVREVLAFYRMQPQSASLEAEQMLRDGLTVLRRGHAPDPRIAHPTPEHANGAPPQELESQQFYLLCWCAGLLIGQQKSTLPLLALLGEARCRSLYPDAIAQCLFEAATLPTCRTRDEWLDLWPDFHRLVEEFLPALEDLSQTPRIAEQALVELKRMILRASSIWAPVVVRADHDAAEHRSAIEKLDREKVAFDAERARQQLRAEAAERDRDVKADEIRRLEESIATLLEAKAETERQRTLVEERLTALAAEHADRGRRHGELENDYRALQAEQDALAQRHERLSTRYWELEAKLWVRAGRTLRVVKTVSPLES